MVHTFDHPQAAAREQRDLGRSRRAGSILDRAICSDRQLLSNPLEFTESSVEITHSHSEKCTATASLRLGSLTELTESFRVRDAKDQALEYIHFEDETGRRTAMGA